MRSSRSASTTLVVLTSLLFAASCTRIIRVPSPPEQTPAQRPPSCGVVALDPEPLWQSTPIPAGTYALLDPASGELIEDDRAVTVVVHRDAQLVDEDTVRADTKWHARAWDAWALVELCWAALPPAVPEAEQ